MIKELLEAIHSLEFGQNYKPHRHICLLAAINYLEKRSFSDNRIYYDDDFKSIFSSLFEQYSRENDRNRPSNPFFHLRSLPIWILIANSGKENELTTAPSVGGSGDLNSLVSYAKLRDKEFNILQMPEHRASVKQELIRILENYVDARAENGQHITNVTDNKQSRDNLFCDYLSSLISTNVFNENAIAESQAINPMFKTIHMTHPLVDVLLEKLKQKTGKHVILTGHAGDGKTTIAIDVIKALRGMPPSEELKEPLEQREEVDEHRLSIIKDFSERDSDLDSELIDELKSGRRRFMIISNTGTLLNFFKNNSQAWQANSVEAESKILTAISKRGGKSEVEFAKVEFVIYNLAYIDNLQVAEEVFGRMLAPENWRGCDVCSHNDYCPIRNNVEFIREAQAQVTERLFLLYRRMYEYGGRLTLRQLTSHLAYIISSGISSDHVSSQSLPKRSEYLFFNRLFGDDGKNPDASAGEMRAIVELKRQGLGEIYSPSIEMSLWRKHSNEGLNMVLPAAKELFVNLRDLGARTQDVIKSEQARRQLRRLLYFYENDDRKSDEVIVDFLNSANILNWYQWQRDGAELQTTARVKYKKMAFHVIQEHFTGLKLPEGTSTQHDRLYVTLTRKQSEVKQSAQVVIAEFDWEQSTTLELDRKSNAAGVKYTELILKGRGIMEGISLGLDLPFLDYITQRHYGEIANQANAAYKERLENMKLQILKKAASQKDEMILIRMRNDNRFKRQRFIIGDQTVEVYDA